MNSTSGRRTTNVEVALADHGAIGGGAQNASLSKLLDGCLVELTSVQRRDDTSKLCLEELAACITTWRGVSAMPLNWPCNRQCRVDALTSLHSKPTSNLFLSF